MCILSELFHDVNSCEVYLTFSNFNLNCFFLLTSQIHPVEMLNEFGESRTTSAHIQRVIMVSLLYYHII